MMRSLRRLFNGIRHTAKFRIFYATAAPRHELNLMLNHVQKTPWGSATMLNYVSIKHSALGGAPNIFYTVRYESTFLLRSLVFPLNVLTAVIYVNVCTACLYRFQSLEMSCDRAHSDASRVAVRSRRHRHLYYPCDVLEFLTMLL